MINSAILLKEFRKTRLIVIIALAFSLLIGIAFMLFYKPKVEMDSTLYRNKEREKKALELQTVAFQQLINEQARRIEALSIKDSQLMNQTLKNFDAIKNIKVRTNERIDRFNTYGSSEWAEYFSNLPEPKGQ